VLECFSQLEICVSKNENFRLYENVSFNNTVVLELKNYIFLGFDKILLTNEEQFPALSKILGSQYPSLSKSDIIFFLQIEPDLINEIEGAYFGLKQANHADIESAIRALQMPQPTGAQTASGTYYLYGKTSSLHEASIQRTFIAKPALQEAGGAHNPHGNKDQTRDGIAVGEGVIRERLVYKGQQLLGDCGIPTTVITRGKNSLLNSQADMKKINESLNSIKKIHPDITLARFLDLMKNGKTVKEIIASMTSFKSEIQDHFQEEVNKVITGLKSDRKEITVRSVSDNLLMFSKPYIRSHVVVIKQAMERDKSISALEENVKIIWDELLISGTEEALMSMQKYVANCQTLGGLSEEEQNGIPHEEIHKFVIDLIFFNTDRHLQNALVNKKEGSSHLVLIDHGSCLPRPLEKEECKGLKQARFEFLTLPQCNVPLHPNFANPIEKLEIETYIEELKKDQVLHQNEFGKLCEIPNECYELIRLNLHVIKTGIKMGATLKSMGSFQQITQTPHAKYGGEIAILYLKHIKDQHQVDWSAIDEDIRSILSKTDEQGTRQE